MEWVKIFSSSAEMLEQMHEGVPRAVSTASQSICLGLGRGLLKVIANKCPHNGESLSKGTVNYLGEVICPWHGYRFNLKNGREAVERCRDAETFPVKENDEGVFVGL
ncbi:MAG: Rieske (2Fe-2S) protein [Cytophagales bacterium]